MLEHNDVHRCNLHQDTIGWRYMINFEVVSSDLMPHVLETGVRGGAVSQTPSGGECYVLEEEDAEEI